MTRAEASVIDDMLADFQREVAELTRKPKRNRAPARLHAARCGVGVLVVLKERLAELEPVPAPDPTANNDTANILRRVCLQRR